MILRFAQNDRNRCTKKAEAIASALVFGRNVLLNQLFKFRLDQNLVYQAVLYRALRR